MKEQSVKRVIVIAGASAVGKTTVVQSLLRASGDYRYVASATTRPPRADANVAEYRYFSEGEFRALVADGKMLEYTEYNGNLYGTPADELGEIFAEGKTPLLVLDLNGVEALRKRSLDFSVFAVYIYEDINVVERRLYQRELGSSPTVDGLEAFQRRRLRNAMDYISLPERAHLFDAFVKNESPEACAAEILALCRAAAAGELAPSAKNAEIAAALAASAREKELVAPENAGQ